MHIMLSSLTVQAAGPHRTLGAQAGPVGGRLIWRAGVFASAARAELLRMRRTRPPLCRRGIIALPTRQTLCYYRKQDAEYGAPPRLAPISAGPSGPPSIEKIKLAEVFIEVE